MGSEFEVGLMNQAVEPFGNGDSRETGSDLVPGCLLNGTFRIRHPIAEGGMGVVYLATHERLPGLFVVKTPRPSIVGDDQIAARLRQEAQVLASLNHPNIVRVIDFNETSAGTPYVVMEFLDGRDLNEILRARPLRPWEVAAIVRQVADGLNMAHACNIVHRDLKPENVLIVPLVGREDVVKLIDFGVSKLGSSPRSYTGKDLIGTPNYMSPEQASGDRQQVNARTDQFALAVMTYEMLAGEPPFADSDPLAVLYQIVNEPAPPLAKKVDWKPTAVERVLRRGMEKDPRARFATVREFSGALHQALHADVGGPREALRLFANGVGARPARPRPEEPRTASPPVVSGIQPIRASACLGARPEIRTDTSPAPRSHARRPRKAGTAAWLLLAATVIAAGFLLWHPRARPAITSWRSELGFRVQALLVQTRTMGVSSTVAKPGIFQPRSSDSGSAQPSPP
jgi:eukaryotic-like serine/threonine-protein kinase